MNVLVIAAATGDVHESIRLRPGDRAAILRGVQFAGAGCRIRVPLLDRTAMIYAAAAGGFSETWEGAAVELADLIVIGPGAIDVFGDELAGRLADRAGATLWFDVLQFEPHDADWKIISDAGQGARKVVHVAGPVVLVLSELVERPPYISQFRLGQAARLIPELSSTTENRIAWQPVSPRPPRAIRTQGANSDDRTNAAFGIEAGAASSVSRHIIADTPQVCAQMLLRFLVQFGFVTRTRPLPAPPTLSTETGVLPTVQSAVPDRRQDSARIAPGPRSLQRRGPRQAADSEQRLHRRPRLVNTNVAVVRPGLQDALRRGPRRLVGGTPPGRRGPFRLLPQRP